MLKIPNHHIQNFVIIIKETITVKIIFLARDESYTKVLYEAHPFTFWNVRILNQLSLPRGKRNCGFSSAFSTFRSEIKTQNIHFSCTISDQYNSGGIGENCHICNTMAPSFVFLYMVLYTGTCRLHSALMYVHDQHVSSLTAIMHYKRPVCVWNSWNSEICGDRYIACTSIRNTYTDKSFNSHYT